MPFTIDAHGIQRSTISGLTPEGRDVPAGTTRAQYTAMLAAESAANLAGVRATDPPKMTPGERLRILGSSRTNVSDVYRRHNNIKRVWIV